MKFNPELYRVLERGQTMLPGLPELGPQECCKTIGFDWSSAKCLREKNFISFDLAIDVALTETQIAELRFLGCLYETVRGDTQLLAQILSPLKKPYAYSTDKLYFDWARRSWLPKLDQEPWSSEDCIRLIGDCLDMLEDKQDVNSLESIQGSSKEAIARLRADFLPEKTSLPFFTYGIFKPGQLAFFQIQKYLKDLPAELSIPGNLLLRDGLPIFDADGGGQVKGMLLSFSPENAHVAYAQISSMEPENHYRWTEHEFEGNSVNLLIGKSPNAGSEDYEEDEWSCWDDPLFTEALCVVKEIIDSELSSTWDMKPFFRLQMAYMLLWSSIERYLSLRYHLGSQVVKKIKRLAREPAFVTGLKNHVKDDRKVSRADRPRDKYRLDPASPKSSIGYYYQVRSNIVHRGKGQHRDFDHVKLSLTELFHIFEDVLVAAKQEAKYHG